MESFIITYKIENVCSIFILKEKPLQALVKSYFILLSSAISASWEIDRTDRRSSIFCCSC